MNNEKSISMAIGLYQNDYDDYFPYGIPSAPGTFNYSGLPISKPHQEIMLAYLNNPKEDFICPADESPEDYWYWKFRDHPNYQQMARGSSYMFSEQSILGIILWNKEMLSLNNIVSPSTLGYMAEGRAYPNGWRWDNANYMKPTGARVDWTHLEMNNFLFADGHVEPIYHFDTATVRTDPRL